MTTKGYHRYRGRNTRGKVALVVVLVLILLAAVAYLLTQEYVVYDDEGKAHLELPWSRKEPKKPQPDSTPVPDDVDITREEPQRQKVEAIHAWELPYGCLGSDPGYLLTDREAVAVNVKMYDGSVAYHTAVALPEGILTGGLSTSRNLQTILDSNCYAVARLACFCDNAFADAQQEQAALCAADGTLYRDGSGRRWLDPSKPGTLRYITDLAKECAQMALTRFCWIGSCIPSAAISRLWSCLPTRRWC